ncbi:MAG: glycosyl hydrolase, partial [Chloroflexota bacterium]
MLKLINPQATPAAQRLYHYLSSLPSGSILTGQHNFPATISLSYDRVHALTGKYPAVWGQDFGFAAQDDKDSIYARDQIVEEVIRQHQNGAIITLMWHAVRPTDDEPGTFESNVLTRISTQTYADLVTPGSEVYKRWLTQTDVIAGYLKRLHAADIPVLWRPYHEMNGAWFWWGARRGSRFIDLWKQHYHYLTEHHGLNNLVWVWNTNAPNSRKVKSYKTLYPGDDYADVLA